MILLRLYIQFIIIVIDLYFTIIIVFTSCIIFVSSFIWYLVLSYLRPSTQSLSSVIIVIVIIIIYRGFHLRSSFCAQPPLCNLIPGTDEGAKYNFWRFLLFNFVPPVLNHCVSDCLHLTPLCSRVVAGRCTAESSSKVREKWFIWLCVYTSLDLSSTAPFIKAGMVQ